MEYEGIYVDDRDSKGGRARGSERSSQKGSKFASSSMKGSKAGSQATYQTDNVDDYEYFKFLETWGHVDFSCLPFLPRIMNAEQLAAAKRIQAFQGVRF